MTAMAATEAAAPKMGTNSRRQRGTGATVKTTCMAGSAVSDWVSATTSRQDSHPERCATTDWRSVELKDCSTKAVSISASGCTGAAPFSVAASLWRNKFGNSGIANLIPYPVGTQQDDFLAVFWLHPLANNAHRPRVSPPPGPDSCPLKPAQPKPVFSRF